MSDIYPLGTKLNDSQCPKCYILKQIEYVKRTSKISLYIKRKIKGDRCSYLKFPFAPPNY